MNDHEVCTMSICVNDDLVFASVPVQVGMRHLPGFQEHLLRGIRWSLAETVARRLQPYVDRRPAKDWDDSNPVTQEMYCTADVLVNGVWLAYSWTEPAYLPAFRRDAEQRARHELAAMIVDRVEPMVHWRPAELFDRGPGLQGNTALQPWRGELTVTAGNGRG